MNWKVAGSISDGVIGTAYQNNPSGHIVVLGSNQSVTEMSTRNISWGVQVVIFISQLSCKLAASTFWNPQGLSRIALPLVYPMFIQRLQETKVIENSPSQ